MFERSVTFEGARFKCPAEFERPQDERRPSPGREEVCFKGWADFTKCRFEKRGGFGGAQFERRAIFERAVFHGDAVFDGATFERARTFGFVILYRCLRLDRAHFDAPLELSASGGSVSCRRTQFLGRTTMSLAQAELSLEHAEFAQPSVVEGGFGPAALPDADEDDLEFAERRKPRVTSLSRANVANLTLADADLTCCEFAGAHNLDRLRFEGATDLLPSPRWRTKRRIVREETELPPHGVPRQRAAVRNARIYRALRKGREDNKDEPGAADFYYGEMEMRRKAWRRLKQDRGSAGTTWPEWVVLTLYWLVSGYGLRASRALLALAVTVLAFAWGFDQWGFTRNPTFGDTLLFSAESTSSLFRAPTPPDGARLTGAGHVLQIGLRLLGPLFFGLALLALRGRVKR